jgi:hypothetical protein
MASAIGGPHQRHDFGTGMNQPGSANQLRSANCQNIRCRRRPVGLLALCLWFWSSAYQINAVGAVYLSLSKMGVLGELLTLKNDPAFCANSPTGRAAGAAMHRAERQQLVVLGCARRACQQNRMMTGGWRTDRLLNAARRRALDNWWTVLLLGCTTAWNGRSPAQHIRPATRTFWVTCLLIRENAPLNSAEDARREPKTVFQPRRLPPVLLLMNCLPVPLENNIRAFLRSGQ